MCWSAFRNSSKQNYEDQGGGRGIRTHRSGVSRWPRGCSRTFGGVGCARARTRARASISEARCRPPPPAPPPSPIPWPKQHEAPPPRQPPSPFPHPLELLPGLLRRFVRPGLVRFSLDACAARSTPPLLPLRRGEEGWRRRTIVDAFSAGPTDWI